MSETLWQAVVYLHLLAMAFFLGGQLLIAVAVVPVERGEENRERLRAIARRFGWGALVALAVLLATGVAMASHFHYWGSGTLHVKLGLVGLVTVLVAVHLRYPRAHLLQAAIFLVTLAIVWAGVDLAG
jgi:uncharacterized membrane protein